MEAEEEYRRQVAETVKSINKIGMPAGYLEREIKKIRQKEAKEKMEAKVKKAKEEKAKASQTQ